MSGETDLDVMLSTLKPILDDTNYVFVSIAEADQLQLILENVSPIAVIQESEGTTLVLHSVDADARELPYESTYQRITLSVHSSLLAVGLTASVSSALALAGISANMIAGYYHDHLFVPSDQADQAIAVLCELSSKSSSC